MKIKSFYPLFATLLLGVLAAIGVGFNVFFLALTLIIFILFYRQIQASKNRVMIYLSLVAVAFFVILALFLQPEGGTDPAPAIIINYLLTIPLTVASLTLIVCNDFSVPRLLRAGIRTAVLSPLTDMPFFFRSLHDLISRKKPAKTKVNAAHVGQAVIAVICVALLLLVILPILASADPMFAKLVSIDLGFLPNFGEVFRRALVGLLVAMVLYSLFHNVEARAENRPAVTPSAPAQIGAIISNSVLGAALAVYALFIGVQFVYLFAGAGLPDGLTYSEYARQGFFQMIVVCCINLSLFSVFLAFNKSTPLLKALLSALLAATALILLSSYIRLSLYIAEYGLTFLRLISMWFNVYITAAIGFLFVKLLKKPELDVFRIGYPATLVWWLIFVVGSVIILP
jgi:hypothetical protein